MKVYLLKELINELGCELYWETSSVTADKIKAHNWSCHPNRGYEEMELEDFDDALKEEYTCKFCGSPSEVDPSDQVAPADYCHPEDHIA